MLILSGCFESEQPLMPLENEEPAALVPIQDTEVLEAPEPEISTTIIKLDHSWKSDIRIVEPHKLTKIFSIFDGRLAEVDVVMPNRCYYLLKPVEIDGVPVNQNDDESPTIFFNVLDSNIVIPEPKVEMIGGLWKIVNEPIDLDWRNRVEVVIKRKFRIKKEGIKQRLGIRTEEVEIIFVDVVRILTHPHMVDKWQHPPFICINEDLCERL